jgi:hypothetical protein
MAKEQQVPNATPSAIVAGTGVMTPEALEKLRQIGLRLDRAGVFWHGDAKVEHPRLHLALLRWLDVVDGKDVVRLDEQRFAYVDVEDAHLRATSAHWEGDRCKVTWDDDCERELCYQELAQAPDNALYVKVGKLTGRIGSPAYHSIVDHAQEDGSSPTGFALAAKGQSWPIQKRPG